MKKIILILILAPGLYLQMHSQDKFTISAMIHQTGMYYSSDNITSDGFGLGLGIHVRHKSQVAAQADANILWGNGNAITTRIALGYEKKGSWTPGLYATLNMAWGQRVQLLSESGKKPPVPVWIAGVRITPLKFRTKTGYLSALELGYGFGPERGMSLEFSVLAIGIRF